MTQAASFDTHAFVFHASGPALMPLLDARNARRTVTAAFDPGCVKTR